MKKKFLALAGAGILGASAAALAGDIPVDRVVLSSSGLAHFERRAQVQGDTSLTFPVRLDQVDDVLKSLVVFDEKGSLGGVTLPGRQPLEQAFRDLPFTRDQMAQPMLLLNAYQGARLSARGPGFEAAGRILSVQPEQAQTEDGSLITRHRLSLMTDAGVKQAVLEDLASLRFDDENIRAEISRALDAVRENARAGTRDLSVHLSGAGARAVTLAYVVEAPLWKAAWRMVLPAPGGAEGLMQGWAVIENATAGDWKNVDVTLVSGNPVTYRQALYESYYVQRPELPVQVFGRVMPRVDGGALSTAAEMESAGKEMKSLRRGEASGRADMMMAAPMAMEAYASAPPGMDAVAQGAQAAQSAEATTQVLYRFPQRFSLKAGQSMMLPFASRRVPLARVSLYQPETHATHPLAAVKIKNDGETGLPPGILTLYEENAETGGTAFVGDAQLPAMAAGEARLVSYALDSKTHISREDKSDSAEGRVTISRGVLNVSVVHRAETVYTVKAPPREDRTVIVEHPRRHDHKLVTPAPEEAEVTDTHYRLRLDVKAGESKTFPVVLEQQAWRSAAVSGLPADELQAWATGRGDMPAETRKAFAALAERRRALDDIDRRIALRDAERGTIFQDQERLRDNLDSLHGKSDVREKYLEKLNAQEDRIGVLDAEKKDLAGQRDKALRAMQETAEKMEM